MFLTYIVIRFRLKAPKQRVQGGFYLPIFDAAVYSVFKMPPLNT